MIVSPIWEGRKMTGDSLVFHPADKWLICLVIIIIITVLIAGSLCYSFVILSLVLLLFFFCINSWTPLCNQHLLQPTSNCRESLGNFSGNECIQHRCTHDSGISLSHYEVLGPEAMSEEWPTRNGIGFVVELEWTGDVCGYNRLRGGGVLWVGWGGGIRRFKESKSGFSGWCGGKFAHSSYLFLNPDGIYLWSWRNVEF